MKPTCHNPTRYRIDDINREIRTDPNSLIQASEAAFKNQVEQAARLISGGNRQYKILLIAGPSASGKTTAADLLCRELTACGIGSLCISLDNFFLDSDKLPLLPDGTRDHESIDTICFPALYKCYDDLFRQGSTYLPVFDFSVGKRRDRQRKVTLHAGDVLVLEGIHALHPRMLTPQHRSRFFRIYVSASADFEDEKGNTVLSSEDLRLIRRMIRDHRHRFATAERTFEMWENVCRAEKEYILPLMPQADCRIATVHAYEPALYLNRLNPILSELPESSKYDQKRHELIRMLKQFAALPESMLPAQSLLQEFLE